MKITLITATFNSEKNLRDCMQSLAEQSFKNIEHIVVDGFSTDGTMEIVRSFPSVSQYISEPDKGIYDALNKGIQMATGDVIGFVHSGDMLASKEIISKIVESFFDIGEEKKGTPDGIYGNLVFVDPQYTNKVVRNWVSAPFAYNRIKYGWTPPHPTLFLRKEVYQKHGLFDTSFKIAGDYDFMLRVMLNKELNLCYLPEVITRMRLGGASTGNISVIINKMLEDVRALRKNGFRFPLAVLAAKNLRKLPQLFYR